MLTSYMFSVSPDYRFKAVHESHGWRMLLPYQYDPTTETLLRLELLPDGQAVQLQITQTDEGVLLRSDVPLADASWAILAQRMEHALDIQTDLSEFYALLEQTSPRLAWVAPQGAGRMLKSPTVWEDLVKTLLTTNVNWKNTISMVSRLVTNYDHTFPTPQQIAMADPVQLNATIRAGYRITSLMKLAQAIDSGNLEVEAWRTTRMTSAEQFRLIRQLHGFGDYATGAMMRLLGYHDYLGLDSVCRSAFSVLHHGGQPTDDKTIEGFYEPFGKWRGLVLWMDVLSTD